MPFTGDTEEGCWSREHSGKPCSGWFLQVRAENRAVTAEPGTPNSKGMWNPGQQSLEGSWNLPETRGPGTCGGKHGPSSDGGD